MQDGNRLALVFPGQGSQSVGMLAELAARTPIIERSFAEASHGAELDLWQLASSGPPGDLGRTELTQPVMLAADVAVYRAWRESGGAVPAVLAGHSLGEYAALVVAGVLELADAAKLVRTRGRLMQAAVPEGAGAMAAILGCDDLALIEQSCRDAAQGEVLVPANFNAPGQTVIAGHLGALERALVLLAERGVRKSVRLPVSVPAHTPLMRDAAQALAAQMDTLTWHTPVIEIIHNVDVASHHEPQAIRAALVAQLSEPVRWTESVAELVRRGCTRIGECGPGKALTGMVKRCAPEVDARSLGSAADFDAALAAWC